jgi:hypothetical protein
MSNSISRVVALLAVVGLASPAYAGSAYNFIRLVDHADDDFGPRTLTCASINASGDVAFKGTRSAPDGLSSWDVIARVNRAGVITTIAEDPAKTQFQFFSSFVSINDSGETSFGAFLSNDDIAILRSDGTSTTTIASTAGAFASFGFDATMNDSGEVAFTAGLDDGSQGLFSGSGGPVTTHYTNATPVLVDGVTTSLAGGNFGRPSINDAGEIAFWDRVEPAQGEGIFAGREGVFRTLGPTDRVYNGAATTACSPSSPTRSAVTPASASTRRRSTIAARSPSADSSTTSAPTASSRARIPRRTSSSRAGTDSMARGS